MGFAELLLLAVGLSMDAFAVSICKGLAMKRTTLKAELTCGVWFGGFQALMPLIGFFLGTLFAGAIEAVDHWVACLLLVIIGINMLKEAFGQDEECESCGSADLSVKTMFVMAVATSIDALALGVTFACLDVDIAPACLCIGSVTCLTSALGVALGGAFGARWKMRAEAAGGAILILIGLKILIEHLIRG